jgi:DnaJ-class molecular chaperone
MSEHSPDPKRCSTCAGTGRVLMHTCADCDGTGRARRIRTRAVVFTPIDPPTLNGKPN